MTTLEQAHCSFWALAAVLESVAAVLAQRPGLVKAVVAPAELVVVAPRQAEAHHSGWTVLTLCF